MRGRKVIDLVGCIYRNEHGWLEVIKRTNDHTHSPTWLCLCFCGNRVKRQSQSLRGGKTFSCGCTAKKKGPNRKVITRGNVAARIQLLYPQLSTSERIAVERIVGSRSGPRDRPLMIRLEAIQCVMAERLRP